MRPGLTLVCVTKDQAGKLMRMLQSVQGVVDDIVVFDTGSKDLSPGVARMQGARTFQIDWPGSFADAFNQAMKQVETEWTFRLDTDEWLLPGTGSQIRKLIGDDKAFGYNLIRQDLSDDVHYSESWRLRLWRSDPGLYYEGFIHEHFPDDVVTGLKRGREIYSAPIGFRHDGFLGGSSDAKHRRNIALLQKELEARPDSIYFQVELVLTMILLHEPGGNESVDRLADQILSSDDERPGPIVATLLAAALIQVKRRDLGSERTQRMIDKSWEWFDASPPLLWDIARTELRRNNLEGTYRALLRLEELSETEGYEREWTYDGRILHESLWEFLAQIATALGHPDVANRNLVRLGRLSSDAEPSSRDY